MADVEQTAVEKKGNEPWQIKEALIAIPLMASALALTWELGFFAKIAGGSFGLFSTAEHLTFALQALPVALGMTALGVMGLIQKQGIGPFRTKFRIFPVIVAYAGGLFFAAVFLPLDFFLSAVSALAALPYLFVLLAPRQLFMNPLTIFGGVLFLFFVAFTVGFASAGKQIRSSLPLNSIKIGEKGKETETEIKVRILRTGERGILYYDPAAQAFGLLPWDYVKRVDWAISSVWVH